MGCRRKMWLCLSLWYALMYAACVGGKHAIERSKLTNNVLPFVNITDKLSKADRESENVSTSAATGLLNGETEYFHNFSKLHKSAPIVVPDESKSRVGYEKDLMLVMPVNSNTNGSDLQMWYTQSPVTAIIEDSTIELEHRADYDMFDDQKREDDRHPYTNFLVNKPLSKPTKPIKSPLDYGYPESFKFVEDLNGLPSNHKPEWASTNAPHPTETTVKAKTTTVSPSTKYNPFEMFESVKPLEINKLLSFQQVIQTSSEFEETTTERKNETESNIHAVPKRPTKRPTKKPQKIKPTAEPTTESIPQVNASSAPISPIDSEQLYAAVRYTTLLSQSTKDFLPTHMNKIKPILKPSVQYEATSTTSTTTTTTEPVTFPKITTTTEATTVRIPTTTTPAPTTTMRTTTSNFINDIVVYNETDDSDDSFPADSFDTPVSQNISDFPLENFQPPKDLNFYDMKPFELEPIKETSPALSGDMLTNDMKNMLIALGILKSEEIPPSSTTQKVIVRKELVTPNIDPNSYTSFKKIPIDIKKETEKGNISDDMKDLLASFGLLPKKTSQNESTSGARISRQQNLTETNFTAEVSSSPVNFTEIDSVIETVSNGSTKSLPGSGIESDVGDFFNEKPIESIDVNSDMLTDEMKNTLEDLGLFKRSGNSRTPKSGHVFQPTTQLEELNKDDNVKKITDVLRTIKQLSYKTETNDITAEELEKQLLNLTATLENEDFADVNETLLLELNEMINNDTNLKIVESIGNMTKKMELNRTSTTENLIFSFDKTSTTENLISAFDNITENLVVAVQSTTTKNIVSTPNITSTTENLVSAVGETSTAENMVSVSNITSTTENIVSILNKTSSTENIVSASNNSPVTVQPEMKPPNPLSTAELFQLYEMGKNEIRRQEPNVTSTVSPTTLLSEDDTAIPGASTESFVPDNEITTVMSSTSSTTSTSPSSSTSPASSSESINDAKGAENNNAPVADLADSFGGAEIASNEPSADDLPTPKPNGLYFYLDWNTFLHVGAEDDRSPVRIRFTPRAGNARNFLPITVP